MYGFDESGRAEKDAPKFLLYQKSEKCETGAKAPKTERPPPKTGAAFPARIGRGFYLSAMAWSAVMATVLTMSATRQPRERSLTGLLRPWMTGPMATALAVRWTAL